MKRSKVSILLVLCVVMGAWLLSSCAPRIYGARPHRRDRHCGCENKTQGTDTLCLTTPRDKG